MLQPTLAPLLSLSSELDLKGVCRTAVPRLWLLVGPCSVFIQEAAKLRAAELSSEADVNVSFQNMFAPGFFLFQLVLIALCCHSTLHDPKITRGERRQQLLVVSTNNSLRFSVSITHTVAHAHSVFAYAGKTETFLRTQSKHLSLCIL